MSLDVQTAELLRQLRPKPDARRSGLLDIGVDAVRAAGRAIFHAYAGEPPGACVTGNLMLAACPQPIPARLYHLGGEDWRAAPLIVFLHGGGWFQGDLDCYDVFLRDLCVRSGATLLSVAYRLAPEHRYPAALEDGLTAMRWAVQFARTHCGTEGRLAVMGDSAGGNLATVIARRLHSEAGPRLSAQFLLYPMLDVSKPHAAFPSRLQFGGGEYLLTCEGIDAAAAWYLERASNRTHPDVSPLLMEDVSMLPQTSIVIGGHDPLLDEARLYAERLLAAGVPTRLRCFETTIHAFLSFGVLDVARQGRAYLADEIKRCLFADQS
jgi:acetyl esterase